MAGSIQAAEEEGTPPVICLKPLGTSGDKRMRMAQGGQRTVCRTPEPVFLVAFVAAKEMINGK